MECAHPDHDADPDPYAGSIITWENGGNGVIPDECPLRKADLRLKKKVTKIPFDGSPAEVVESTTITYSLLNDVEREFVKNASAKNQLEKMGLVKEDWDKEKTKNWTETQYLHLNGLDGGCGK
jgi:hypothetical protein